MWCTVPAPGIPRWSVKASEPSELKDGAGAAEDVAMSPVRGLLASEEPASTPRRVGRRVGPSCENQAARS
jgi:hypothetical protein